MLDVFYTRPIILVPKVRCFTRPKITVCTVQTLSYTPKTNSMQQKTCDTSKKEQYVFKECALLLFAFESFIQYEIENVPSCYLNCHHLSNVNFKNAPSCYSRSYRLSNTNLTKCLPVNCILIVYPIKLLKSPCKFQQLSWFI